MIGNEEDCPICGKHKLVDMDCLYECFNCGAYETVDKKTGEIWTHIKLPIEKIKAVEKK